jgi:23S rRNA pseudouridine955/2504/2580 synthase
VKKYYVTEDFNLMRIERFLFKMTKIPKISFLKIIRKGLVAINDKKINIGHRILKGDVVIVKAQLTISLPAESSEDNSLLHNQLKKRIYYEDASYIVMNKIININSQAGSTYSLDNFAKEYGAKNNILLDKENLFANSNYINEYKLVHRLDKETSGTFFLAKNNMAAAFFSRSLMYLKKYYLTILCGRIKQEIKINEPIEKIDLRCIISENGKSAETIFLPISYYKDLTLCLVKPLTGRTHQIRVHAAYNGTPVLGDIKYGGEESERLFLHCLNIQFNNINHISFLEAAFKEKLVFFNISLNEILKFIN